MHVHNIEMRLQNTPEVLVAAGIAEMLRLLPGLRSFNLDSGYGPRPPILPENEVEEAARLVVSGLANN